MVIHYNSLKETCFQKRLEAKPCTYYAWNFGMSNYETSTEEMEAGDRNKMYIVVYFDLWKLQ